MAGSSVSGNAYEKEVANFIETLKFKECPIVVWGTARSDKNAPDIDAHCCDGPLLIEAKTKKGFEFGSSKFQFMNGKYELPDNPLIQSQFPSNFQPFNGFIPSFLRGDPSQEALYRDRDEQEKLGNPLDVRFPVNDPLLAAKYYAAKRVNYIQIQGRGLYHTGFDAYNLGVPILSMLIQIRYRCKTHKSNLSHSVQAQINYVELPSRSPYDLTDLTRLPHGFSVK